MYNDINRCIFTGRLGRDAELRYTASGVPVINLRLAVAGSRRADGEWENTTTWVRVIRWFRQDADDSAQSWAGRLKKGARIAVEGRWQNRSWEDRHGQKHYATDVIAERIHILSKVDPKDESNDVEPDGGDDSIKNIDDDVPF